MDDKSLKWIVIYDEGFRNVLPIDDSEDHEENSTCKCNPKVELLEDGDFLIIHNSYDGREIMEKIIDEINNFKTNRPTI